MTANEIELLNIIYECDKPDQAVMTAIKVFAAFLERLEGDPAPQAVYHLESA